MRIGEIAAQAGVTAKTIRYYEQIGLIDAPPRTSAGYRDYDSDAADRLLFIRTAQGVGLSLAEIAQIIEVRKQGTAPCGHVLDVLRAHLADVERSVAELKAVAEQLRGLVQRGERLDPERCEADRVCEIIAGDQPPALLPSPR